MEDGSKIEIQGKEALDRNFQSSHHKLLDSISGLQKRLFYIQNGVINLPPLIKGASNDDVIDLTAAKTPSPMEPITN